MRPEVERDLGKSSDVFRRIVWPAVAPDLRDGEFATVESTIATGFCKDLDTLAGIDGWQICRQIGSMRGIAVRVQYTDISLDTFTIRYKRTTGAETEYSKRLRAIKDTDGGWLMPTLTIQAYVSKDCKRLVGSCVVRTSDLFLYAEKWLPWLLEMESERQTYKNSRLYMRAAREDSNKFLVVPWSGLAEENIKTARRPQLRRN